VDAGAKGFVCFIEGIHEFLKTGKVSGRNISRIEKIDHEKISHSIKDINYKYCTEITIEASEINETHIEALVEAYGDSSIVNNYGTQTRIHVHTDNPHELVSNLSEYGKIVYSKVDNMKIQQDIVHNRKYKIALVTDTIADLPDSYIE
jgi:dihydroxyacetone kinase-like predicted kinase